MIRTFSLVEPFSNKYSLVFLLTLTCLLERKNYKYGNVTVIRIGFWLVSND